MRHQYENTSTNDNLVFTLAMPSAFTNTMTVEQTCDNFVMTISVYDEDQNPLNNTFVQIYEDSRAKRQYIETVKTNSDGIAIFNYSKTTQGINVSKGGFSDVNMPLVCDSIAPEPIKVDNREKGIAEKYAILLESEFGNLAIYESKQQEAMSDPDCYKELETMRNIAEGKSSLIPKWIKDVATF